MTINLPSTPSPPTASLIDLASVKVAKITRAPYLAQSAREVSMTIQRKFCTREGLRQSATWQRLYSNETSNPSGVVDVKACIAA